MNLTEAKKAEPALLVEFVIKFLQLAKPTLYGDVKHWCPIELPPSQYAEGRVRMPITGTKARDCWPPKEPAAPVETPTIYMVLETFQLRTEDPNRPLRFDVLIGLYCGYAVFAWRKVQVDLGG